MHEISVKAHQNVQAAQQAYEMVNIYGMVNND